jgi:hypothetical protein
MFGHGHGLGSGIFPIPHACATSIQLKSPLCMPGCQLALHATAETQSPTFIAGAAFSGYLKLYASSDVLGRMHCWSPCMYLAIVQKDSLSISPKSWTLDDALTGILHAVMAPLLLAITVHMDEPSSVAIVPSG